MSKKPYKRARFVNTYSQSDKNSKKSNSSLASTPMLFAKRVMATLATTILTATFIYDAYMYRNVEINIVRQITTASELSNPCASVEALESVIKTLKVLKMDHSNTSFIPNSPIYPSEPIDQDLGVYIAQLTNSQAVYNLQCNDMFKLDKGVKDITGTTEELKEQEFARLISKNPKLAQYVQTADYSTTQSNTDNKLLDPATKKASIPIDIHLMPNLRLIILARYLSGLLLFVLYFFDVLKVLKQLQLFKLVLFILDKTAPWKIK